MSFAFLPFYTGDYLRDTRHLTPLKHGVYLLLLMHSWDQQGPLPLDEQECAGIANCRSADEVDALRYILDRFWVRMDDGWYNRRMQRELERASAISIKRKSAGSKGYQARAKHLLSKRHASVSTLTPTPTTTTTPTSTPTSTPLASSDKSDSAVSLATVAIPLTGRKEWPVPSTFLTELEAAYPAVDGLTTLREIRAWCVSNPEKCKTERGVKRFLNRWFEKEQNRG